MRGREYRLWDGQGPPVHSLSPCCSPGYGHTITLSPIGPGLRIDQVVDSSLKRERDPGGFHKPHQPGQGLAYTNSIDWLCFVWRGITGVHHQKTVWFRSLRYANHWESKEVQFDNQQVIPAQDMHRCIPARMHPPRTLMPRSFAEDDHRHIFIGNRPGNQRGLCQHDRQVPRPVGYAPVRGRYHP